MELRKEVTEEDIGTIVKLYEEAKALDKIPGHVGASMQLEAYSKDCPMPRSYRLTIGKAFTDDPIPLEDFIQAAHDYFPDHVIQVMRMFTVEYVIEKDTPPETHIVDGKEVPKLYIKADIHGATHGYGSNPLDRDDVGSIEIYCLDRPINFMNCDEASRVIIDSKESVAGEPKVECISGSTERVKATYDFLASLNLSETVIDDTKAKEMQDFIRNLNAR
jgi:hypothetical protein